MWVCVCAGQLKGVMRVGAFARGLLLKGECSVELILMTASKPNISLFQDLSSRLPAKFEVHPLLSLTGTSLVGCSLIRP